MKTEHIINAQEAFSKLLDYAYLPIRTQMKLARLYLQLSEEYRAFEQCKNNLIKKHGKPTEDGNFIISKDDTNSVEAYLLEMSDLFKSEVEIPLDDIPLICISEIEQIDRELPMDKRINLTAKDWHFLSQVLRIDESE